MIEREEYRLIENFNIAKGVSVNKIFVETVFVLFVCINCRFPVFISGQSGSNKSTAVNMFCPYFKKSKIAKIPRFTLQKLPTITFRFTGNSLLQDSALLRGYFKTPNSLQSNFYDFVTTFANLGDVKIPQLRYRGQPRHHLCE